VARQQTVTLCDSEVHETSCLTAQQSIHNVLARKTFSTGCDCVVTIARLCLIMTY